jgi:predicted acyl esterase
MSLPGTKALRVDLVIVTNFPRTVRVIEHTLIPLRDGTMLAARIWLPADAEAKLVPAILEYLPYRKRDGTYERDSLTHPYQLSSTRTHFRLRGALRA